MRSERHRRSRDGLAAGRAIDLRSPQIRGTRHMIVIGRTWRSASPIGHFVG